MTTSWWTWRAKSCFAGKSHIVFFGKCRSKRQFKRDIEVDGSVRCPSTHRLPHQCRESVVSEINQILRYYIHLGAGVVNRENISHYADVDVSPRDEPAMPTLWEPPTQRFCSSPPPWPIC